MARTGFEAEQSGHLVDRAGHAALGNHPAGNPLGLQAAVRDPTTAAGSALRERGTVDRESWRTYAVGRHGEQHAQLDQRDVGVHLGGREKVVLQHRSVKHRHACGRAGAMEGGGG